MSSAWAQAFALVFDPYNLLVMVVASLFGLFVGAVPGLTATMATALLVPVTFFMAPIRRSRPLLRPTAMAIFSGDIPGCLMRMPGTPASAAYTDEAYAMAKKGQAETALGAGFGLFCIGWAVRHGRIDACCTRAGRVPLKFSSFEYFWLVLLGLTCAVFMTSDRPLKGLCHAYAGLLVGMRRTEQSGGDFRASRSAASSFSAASHDSDDDRHVSQSRRSCVTRWTPIPRFGSSTSRSATCLRHVGADQEVPGADPARNAIGTLIGALPGAGADIAAWITYAISKKFSKEPEKFGTGCVEGIVEAGSANNSALAGAWIPALVFGIPGDSITAIVIGVLYMKNMNPGPSLFTNNPQNIYAVYLLFIMANLMMLSAGMVVHQGVEADSQGSTHGVDAGDHVVLRRRFLRDQQHRVRRDCDAHRRHCRILSRSQRLPHCASDTRRRSGWHARGKFRNVDDQVGRPRSCILRTTDRCCTRRDDLAVWFLPLLLRHLRRLAGIEVEQ